MAGRVVALNNKLEWLTLPIVEMLLTIFYIHTDATFLLLFRGGDF